MRRPKVSQQAASTMAAVMRICFLFNVLPSFPYNVKGRAVPVKDFLSVSELFAAPTLISFIVTLSPVRDKHDGQHLFAYPCADQRQNG